MEYPHNIVKFMCAEISDIDKNVAESGRLSVNDLEAVCKYADAIKDFDKIFMSEEDNGYSRDGDWEMEGRGSYERGASYRGRKRDSMGRYSRDGAKDKMMHHLEEMMDAASTEKDREMVRRFMSQMENV